MRAVLGAQIRGITIESGQQKRNYSLDERDGFSFSFLCYGILKNKSILDAALAVMISKSSDRAAANATEAKNGDS